MDRQGGNSARCSPAQQARCPRRRVPPSFRLMWTPDPNFKGCLASSERPAPKCLSQSWYIRPHRYGKSGDRLITATKTALLTKIAGCDGKLRTSRVMGDFLFGCKMWACSKFLRRMPRPVCFSWSNEFSLILGAYMCYFWVILRTRGNTGGVSFPSEIQNTA